MLNKILTLKFVTLQELVIPTSWFKELSTFKLKVVNTMKTKKQTPSYRLKLINFDKVVKIGSRLNDRMVPKFCPWHRFGPLFGFNWCFRAGPTVDIWNGRGGCVVKNYEYLPKTDYWTGNYSLVSSESQIILKHVNIFRF